MAENSKLLCFFIVPFGEENTSERDYYNNLIENLVKPALVECRDLPEFDVKSGLDVRSTDTVRDKVETIIKKSDLCIADVSKKNPNVYYEVGFCRALRKPLICIMEGNDKQKLAADLDGIELCSYDLSSYVTGRQSLLKLRDYVVSELSNVGKSKLPENNIIISISPEQAQVLRKIIKDCDQ